MSTPILNKLAGGDEVQELRARIAELEREQRISRKIMERSPVMISIVRGTEFVYEYVNAAFQALAPGKEFLGRRFAEVWSEVCDPLVEILQNVLRTGETFELKDAPYTIRRRADSSPEVVYVSYSWVPIAGGDGQPDCILTLAHETTAEVRQRQADGKREVDRQLLETLVAELPAGVALIRGSDLKVILVNRAYQANAPGDEMNGETVQKIWPEIHPRFQEICLHVLATGETHRAVDEPITIRRSPEALPEEMIWTWSIFRVALPGEAGWSLMSVTIDNTERKRAEQARLDRDADFETLANLVPQMVWMCTPDGLNFYFNQRWTTYTGLTPEQSAGTGWDGPLHPDDKQAAWDAWDCATRAGGRFSVENRWRGADGRYRWFLTLAEPMKNAAGNVVRWFGTLTDIHALKQAEEALRESEERFRALVNASSDVLYRLSPDAREMRQLRGKGIVADLQTVSSNWLEEYIHPDDRELVKATVRKAIRAKSSVQLEHRIIRLDGKPGWIFSRAVPLKDGSGNIIEWFGAATDITGRKEVEEELRQQAALLDLAHDAIFVRSDEDRVVFWNHGAEATYGFRRDEAMGQVTHQLLKTRFPRPMAEIRHIIAENGQWEGELVHTRKDGLPITVASRWALQRDPSGRDVGILEVNRDISERKRMEQGLRESRDRLSLAQQIARAGSFDLDLRTEIVVWSEELQQLYGIAPGQPHVKMDEWASWILPEDRDRVLAEYAAGLDAGEVATQFRIRRRDSGEVRWLDGRGRVLRDESGAPVRMVGFSIDITEQKKTEEALLRISQRMELAAEAARFGTYDMDLVAGTLYWSREMREILGIPFDQPAPPHDALPDFIHPDDVDEVRQMFARVFDPAGDGAVLDEHRIVRPDGDIRWVQIRGQVQFSGEGSNRRAVRNTGVLLDITEQKRAEAALRQSIARERARATEMEALMNAVPGAIFVADDPECSFIYGNRATYSLLRREPGSNLSKSAPEGEKPTHFRVLQGGIEIPAEELPVQKAARTGQPVKDYELNLIFEDGMSVTWLGGAAPMQDEGRTRGAVGVFVDITKRKRAERALQDSEERLRLAQEAAGVGHFEWNLVTGEMTWSESLERLVGSKPARGLWGKLDRIHSEDRPAFQSQLEDAVYGQASKVSIRYRSTTPAGSPCWRFCEARVHRDENGKPLRMLGVIADITAHKQAEIAQQIEQERKHLEEGIRTFTDGVLLGDGTGRLLSMNPAALQLFGFDSYEEAPRSFVKFTELFDVTNLDGSPVSVDEWPVARALRGAITHAFECRTRNRKTGHTWIASYGCAPVLDETGAIIMVVLGVHDTTAERAATEEVQRANTALHSLSGQLLRLQDEERKRIARELHDGTLQMITAISMNLLMIGRSPNVVGSNETLNLIVEAQELAKRCSRELRTVSYLLHPPDLEELGLVAALRSWVDGFAHRTGIVMDLNLDDPGRIEPDVETALFRIAQEALANVQRHSGSSKAGVSLIVSARELRLEVRDEGNGVPGEILQRAPERLGVGILGMRERARQLGGTLEILTQTSGTTVRAILPRSSA